MDIKKLFGMLVSFMRWLWNTAPPKYRIPLISLAVIAAIGFISFVNGVLVIDHRYQAIDVRIGFPSVVKNGIESQLKKSCVDQGIELGKPYVLESVMQHVSIEADSYQPESIIFAKSRISYVVRALKDFSDTSGEFVESYKSELVTPTRWYGSEVEVDDVNVPDSYAIRFGMTQGEQRTVETGADYRYVLPLKSKRTNMPALLDSWSYENAADVICEFVQVIETHSFNIQPVSDNATTQTPDGIKNNIKIRVGMRNEEPKRTLSARWYNLLPKFHPSIQFRLGAPRTAPSKNNHIAFSNSGALRSGVSTVIEKKRK